MKKQIYYAYILECKNGTKYYGHTNNLIERIKDHTRGDVYSTRNKQPRLVYYEEFNSRSEAFKREMQFKNGKTRRKNIEKLIESFPKAKCQGFNSHIQGRSSEKMDLCRPSDSISPVLIEGGK